MELPPTRDDVAADDGSWFGLGEMRERGILVSKVVLWLMLIEICLGG